MSENEKPAVLVTISIACEFTMPGHHLWRDEGHPSSPTEADVYRVIRKDLGIRDGDPIRGFHIARIITEWNLSDHVTMGVTVST